MIQTPDLKRGGRGERGESGRCGCAALITPGENLRFFLPSLLRLDVQVGLVEHLALVEFEEADAFAGFHDVLARGGVDLGLHLSAEFFLLVLHAFEDVGDPTAAKGFLNVEAVGFIIFEEDVDLVDAAEKIVEVAHDILIRAGEEDAEEVGLPVERVQRDVVLGVLEIDEGGDFPVGVAGDIGEDGVDGGSFLQAVERGDGEELLERPVVEQRLKDGEVADVLVGEELVEIVELFGLVAGVATFFGDLFADLPIDRFGGGAIFEVEVTEVEEGKRLLLFLECVVETFQTAELALVFEHYFEIGDDLVFHLGRATHVC